MESSGRMVREKHTVVESSCRLVQEKSCGGLVQLWSLVAGWYRRENHAAVELVRLWNLVTGWYKSCRVVQEKELERR